MIDAVETVLNSLKLQSSVFCRMELSGCWGFDKPFLQGAPFYVVDSGELWLDLAGGPVPLHAGPGDLVGLPGGDAHSIRSAAASPTEPFKPVLAELGWSAWTPGIRYKTGVLRHGAGSEPATVLIAGVFGFEDNRANPILAELPPVLHLKHEVIGAGSPSWFGSTIRLLQEEVASGRPGSATVAARLADIIFIQALRLYLGSASTKDPGWLRGLTDPRIGQALALMHAHPGRAWTVASLAQETGMSRARFAARFQELLGRGPLDYLTRWRMHEATTRLAQGEQSLAAVAARVGYASDMAFGKAFKRWSGQSPGAGKRRVRSGEGAAAPGTPEAVS